MSASLHTTKVDLDGLLEVLGKNLYSTPAVAVRELIQNAHDACMRDQVENSNSSNNYTIHISTNTEKQQLTIEDNGSGLTDKEIIDYLATVGSGYTRQIRHQTDSNDMIGYFGLGFLSAYVIADKVEVWTTSYQDPDQGWYFSSKGGQKFSLLKTKPRSQGSKVLLHLSDEHSDLAENHTLQHLLEKYCCLLPIDIFLNDKSEPINQFEPPWLDKNLSPLARKKRQLQFAGLLEERCEPICTFPLKENTLNVQGLIWIQDGSGFSTSDYRNVSVFVRNMHITHEARDLLPLWAGFVGCIINSQNLTPTASREGIQTDEAYYALQALIAESLVEGITHVARHEESNWRRILSRHNQALLGAVVSNPELFDQMADDLKLPTSEGDLTPNVILKRSDNRLHLQLENKTSYETVLFKAQMIPVISGYFFAVSSFCHLYAEHKGIKLISLGTRHGNNTMFMPEPDSNTEQQQLQSLLCKPKEALICTRFEPDYIPLILIEDQEILLKQRLESDEADKRIGSALLGLARQYTQAIDDKIERRIFVNMNSSLIHRLLTIADGRQQLVANMLRSFVISLSHGGSNLGENQFATELQTFSLSLEELTADKKQ